MFFTFVHKPVYQYSTAKFFEREHGVEFLKFELDQMTRFADAKKSENVEVDGYVAWCRPPFFLLLPTTTTPNAYIICKVENELAFPDMNQFSSVKGRWKFDIINRNPVKVLEITNVYRASPDFGKIKPDISSKDFVGILFDRWRNIRETTERLVAQSLVSSPTSISERTGGFTLTLGNFSKKNKLSSFLGDLRRFIPKDFTKNRSFSFKIPEFGTTASLPKLGWEDHVSSVENISNPVQKKLDRIPTGLDECSITLLPKTMGPINWNLTGVIKSDYPIVLEENVEHTRVSYDVDPAVYKFILAARMSAPTISKKVYEHSIRKNREELQKFASAYSSFLQRTGNEQFWDLGYKGKPLSVHNLTLSLGRANAADAINAKDVEDSIGLYLKNIDTMLDVNELWAYDKIPPSATMTLEERRIYSFLEENRDQNVQQIAQGLGFPEENTEKMVRMLVSKHLLFEPSPNGFSAI